MTITPHYGLTLIEQSQAQKEVTVNEALMRIDGILNYQAAGGSNINWRRHPSAVTDSGGEAVAIEAAMSAGGNAPFFYVDSGATRTLSFDIPAFVRDGMVVWEMAADDTTTWTITYEESFDDGANYSSPVTVSTIQPASQKTVRLQKQAITAGAARRVRLSFAHDGTASPGYWRGGRYVRNLAFFEFEPENRHDYVVWVGDSISELSVRHHEAQTLLGQYFGHDACVFNEAVSGWKIADVKANIAGILARHPRAQHVVLMIGTNDVADHRPYREASRADIDALQNDMQDIITAITDAGHTLHLARIPYSDFTAAPAVGGTTNEENGAAPFNDALMDRLIAQHSPHLHDGQRGLLDGYKFLRDNHHLFADDPNGIHAYHYGARLLGHYLLLRLGSMLWARTPFTVADDDAGNGVAGAKEQVRISFGSVFGASLGNDSQSLFNATYSGLLDSEENITWNNVRGDATGTFDGLINVEGERCGIGLHIDTAFTAITGNNTTSVVTNGQGTPYIEPAKLSYAANTSGATSQMTIIGLNPNSTYMLNFFGSRDAGGSEVNTYAETVNAVSTTLDVMDNTSNVASLSGLSPNASGELTVTVNRPGSLSVLNVLEIIRE